jgi:hypothetical protein
MDQAVKMQTRSLCFNGAQELYGVTDFAKRHPHKYAQFRVRNHGDGGSLFDWSIKSLTIGVGFMVSLTLGS